MNLYYFGQRLNFFIEGLIDNFDQVEKSSEQFFVKKEKVKEVKSEYNHKKEVKSEHNHKNEVKSEYNHKKRQKLKKTDSSLPQVFT